LSWVSWGCVHWDCFLNSCACLLALLMCSCITHQLHNIYFLGWRVWVVVRNVSYLSRCLPKIGRSDTHKHSFGCASPMLRWLMFVLSFSFFQWWCSFYNTFFWLFLQLVVLFLVTLWHLWHDLIYLWLPFPL
jgi:hypothetical protein